MGKKWPRHLWSPAQSSMPTVLPAATEAPRGPSRGPSFTARGANPTGWVRVMAVTGTRGCRDTQGHTHAGRQGTVGVHGASRMHKGVCPRKRNRWSSQTQTRVSWHHDFRHTTPQRTSKPSATGLLDTQPLSNDTHSLRRNSRTCKPWDTHPFGHTDLSGTEPSNTPLRFTPLGHIPFGHTNPGRITSSNSQS